MNLIHETEQCSQSFFLALFLCILKENANVSVLVPPRLCFRHVNGPIRHCFLTFAAENGMKLVNKLFFFNLL